MIIIHTSRDIDSSFIAISKTDGSVTVKMIKLASIPHNIKNVHHYMIRYIHVLF